MEKTNVLLLGGSGFIGRAILAELVRHPQYHITVLQHRTAIPAHYPGVQVVQGSIGSLRPEQLPFSPDLIIHAARNRTGRFGRVGRLLMAMKGYLENKRLLRRLETMHRQPLLVYLSGSLMYGSCPDKLIVESFPLRPASFARQYSFAEAPLVAAAKNNASLLLLRLPWVIGKGSWFEWNYLQIMNSSRFVPLYGTGLNRMCFIDAAAIGPAIFSLYQLGVTGVLNLYHPEYITQKDWATLMAECSGIPVRKLNDKELDAFGAAVKEAFSTDIWLSSERPELQEHLSGIHKPLKKIIEGYLRPPEDK